MKKQKLPSENKATHQRGEISAHNHLLWHCSHPVNYILTDSKPYLPDRPSMREQENDFDLDDWMEFSKVARYFEIHPKTLNTWFEKGWLAYTVIGKMRYVYKPDIHKMLMRFRRPVPD